MDHTSLPVSLEHVPRKAKRLKRLDELYTLPGHSICGMFSYIWLIFMVNLAQYTIHGSNGK